MNCRREWNREFIDNELTRIFREKPLKTHREKVLFERELSLMPQTQPIVEEIKRGIAIETNDIPPLEAKIKVIYNDINKLYSEISIINGKINTLRQTAKHLKERTTAVETKDRKQFVRACPSNDCRGFLSTAWRCGLCEIWVCSDCHEIKGNSRDTAHTCKEDDLATAKLLAGDSKPCPNCACIIFKIDGCDQMWCTQCQTPFSWRTGKAVAGVVHNPHFYQWQRQQMVNETTDIPCGGLPSLRMLAVARLKLTHTSDKIILDNIHQRLNDITNRVLHDMPAANLVADNVDLRIEYMLNKVSDLTKFKAELQKREKSREKRLAIRRVVEMFSVVGAEILRRIQAAGTDTEVLTMMAELEALRVYFNEQMNIISKRFNCVVPEILTN